MKEKLLSHKASLMCVAAIVLGVMLNLVCSIPVDGLGIPVYFDTIGTITVACLCGYFPGILTGVATNIVKVFTYDLSPYYAFLSGCIAIVSTSFYYKKKLETFSGKLLLIVVLAFVGGVPGAGISWLLTGSIGDEYTLRLMNWLQAHLGIGFFTSDALACFIFDLIDKAVSVTVAMLIIRIIPGKIRYMLKYSGLNQEYVPGEVREMSLRKGERSLKGGTVGVIGMITITSVVAMTWGSYMLYGRFARTEGINDAENAINFILDIVETEELKDCVEKGTSAPVYAEIEDIFDAIRSFTSKMSHMYIVRPEKDGMSIVLDLESRDGSSHKSGDFLPLRDEFNDLYDKMSRSEEIIGYEMKSYRGWTLSVMKPVLLPGGECLCYIGGDIDISSIRDYQNTFLIRVLIITGALLMVALAFGLRVGMNRLILPLNSLTYCTDALVFDSSSKRQEEVVRQLKRLKIRTGDEIEKLYNALKKMTNDSIEHEKNIRQQAQTIAEMQSGLILILADMVENRDSDTGNHTRRTANYVNIIMQGLKKKGYYTDELTDGFISDVTQSAPLHDLGKIGISDTILNKPGKLTAEEFDVMKTHTVIGRDLMERAISEIHGESYLSEAKNLVAYHHEKWNGRGYPEGLAGEDIPLSARIMAIADVFDAVSQKRVYKEAFSFEESVKIIEQDSGISFDPKCVEAFMDSLDEIREVLESDGKEDLAV